MSPSLIKLMLVASTSASLATTTSNALLPRRSTTRTTERYTEVQLLFDDVKFKLNAIIADFATSAVHVKYKPPWLRATN